MSYQVIKLANGEDIVRRETLNIQELAWSVPHNLLGLNREEFRLPFWINMALQTTIPQLHLHVSR
mgnify:CR=1 FL=1